MVVVEGKRSGIPAADPILVLKGNVAWFVPFTASNQQTKSVYFFIYSTRHVREFTANPLTGT
jgi:hypothetical protein